MGAGTLLTLRMTAATLDKWAIDADGLRPLDRKYLEVLREAGRPMGLGTLAARLGVSKHKLRVHERWLLRRGLVRFTMHGRMAVATPATPVTAAAGA